MSSKCSFDDNKYFLSFFAILAILIALVCCITVTSARALPEPAEEPTDAESNSDAGIGTITESDAPTEADSTAAKEAVGPAIVFPLDGNITSPFAQRTDPFYDPASGEEPTYEFHRGIDISAAKSRDILACADGTVTYAGSDSSYGFYLIIEHEGFESLYAHCETMSVEVGRWVWAGESIAVAGSTGRSTGRHLHFEIRIEGVPTDPLDYVGCVFTGTIY